MTNHYSVLGIPNYSSWSVVRKAYITQIKKYHPDVNSTQEAILICQRLNVAKEALETTDKKARYDSRLKYFLTYGSTVAQPTTTTRSYTRRRYTPPPMSRAERVRKNKEHRDRIVLQKYAEGLKKFPLKWRYFLCAIYGVFALGIVVLIVVGLPSGLGLLIGFAFSALWFHAVSYFIDEYYKYHDYVGRTTPLGFDLDKRASRMLFGIYFSGFVFAVLVKMVVGF